MILYRIVMTLFLYIRLFINYDYIRVGFTDSLFFSFFCTMKKQNLSQ